MTHLGQRGKRKDAENEILFFLFLYSEYRLRNSIKISTTTTSEGRELFIVTVGWAKQRSLVYD